MSLAIKTIKSMFNFVLKHPKSFLFSFIINTFILLGIFIMVGGLLAYLGPTFKSLVQLSSFPATSTFFLMNIPRAAGIIFSIFGLIVIFVVGLIENGGFPVLTYNGVKKHDLNIVSIFQAAIKKLYKIFIATLILGIITLTILLPAFFFIYTITNPIFLGISFIFILIFIITCIGIAAFLGIKFWFVFPILMLENKKPLESLRLSWQRTNGHVLSIILVLILYGITVVLPLKVMDALFRSKHHVYIIWNFIEGVILTTLSGILPTIYYLQRNNLLLTEKNAQ